MSNNNQIITGYLPFIMFGIDNNILYWQDFRFQKGIKSDIKFYPIQEINESIVFIGDKHGIIKDNEWNLQGNYGNGAIYVDIKNLPKNTVEWCRKNFLKIN